MNKNKNSIKQSFINLLFGRKPASPMRIVLVTLVGIGILGGIGTLGFIYSGIYDIAASRPHMRLTQTILTTVKRRSVQFHARDLETPNLRDPELIRRGLVLYRQNCVTCHGAPGEARDRMGIGMNPNPPPLVKAAENWTTAEIAWIIAHGLKMAGMPGFELGEEPQDLWAITAFVERLHTLSPDEYRQMVGAVEGRVRDEDVQWLPPEPGWRRLAEKANVEKGKELVKSYGCIACHAIPGISQAAGSAGPPLTRWSGRHYISGRLVNTPTNLVDWIRDPDAFEPGTAMPHLAVTEDDAWAIASYLYSLDGEGPTKR